MRRVQRLPLPERTKRYLAKRQAKVDGGSPVDAVWKSSRQTQAMSQVESTLNQMAGLRQRCMYCWDSRGIDIEHYWPKSSFPEMAFDWENLLLACGGCNREKLDKFELDPQGNPLFISPVDDDPWDHLFFEPRTGLFAARVRAEANGASTVQDPRGSYTLKILQTLSSEGCVEGRLRAYRNLVRAVRTFLASGRSAADTDELIEGFRDGDDYGLGVWFLEREGSAEEPFASLRSREPVVWAKLRAQA